MSLMHQVLIIYSFFGQVNIQWTLFLTYDLFWIEIKSTAKKRNFFEFEKSPFISHYNLFVFIYHAQQRIYPDYYCKFGFSARQVVLYLINWNFLTILNSKLRICGLEEAIYRWNKYQIRRLNSRFIENSCFLS